MEKVKILLKKNLYKLTYTKKSLRGFPFSAEWPVNSMPELFLFYNSLGRILFWVTQMIALITKNRIFRREILLEYFDNINYDNLCNDSLQKILYYTSPFSPKNNQPSHKNHTELIARIEKSYELAYSLDPERFPQSRWWKEMTEEFRKSYFEKNKLKLDILNNFRGTFTSKAQILSDQLKTIIPEKGYALSYRKSLELVLEYHRLSDLINHGILKSVTESFSGNNKCPVYRGQRLSYRLLKLAYYLSQIRENTDLKLEEKINILDLGGGYGGLIRLLAAYYLNSKIFLIELPEVCVFASYFLSESLLSKKIAFLAELNSGNSEIEDSQIQKYDIFVLPTWAIKLIPDRFMDLVINTTSLGEMSKEYGRYYIEQIERVCRGYFYSNNRATSTRQELGYDDFGFLNWNFKKLWLSIIYNYSWTGHIEWIGRIIEK